MLAEKVVEAKSTGESWLKQHSARGNHDIFLADKSQFGGLICLLLKLELHQFNVMMNSIFFGYMIHTLGTPVQTIINEFLEKFQTAFDPPPPPLFWEKCCDFFQNYDDQH